MCRTDGFQRALNFSGAVNIIMKIIPGFRCISSLYCYSSVSYGQRMTTLFRQYWRMTVKFESWRSYTEVCILHSVFTLTQSAFHPWSTAICVLPSVFILPLPCSLQSSFYTDRSNVGLSCLKIQISRYLLEAEMTVSPSRSTTTTKFFFTLHIV